MESWNINTIIAMGAVLLAALALATKMLDKGLSLREFTEFKESVKEQLLKLTQRADERLVIREFVDWRKQINTDLDKVEGDIKTIELTRPSSGELKMATEAVSARLAVIEDLIKLVVRNNGKIS